MKNTFELEHVGINTDNAGEAEQLALLLCKLFNLEPRHGQKSEFAGNYFECMKSPFLGKNGHIAMRTPDLRLRWRSWRKMTSASAWRLPPILRTAASRMCILRASTAVLPSTSCRNNAN